MFADDTLQLEYLSAAISLVTMVTITCNYSKTTQNKSKKKQLQNFNSCLTVLTLFGLSQGFSDVIELLIDDWLVGL